MKDKLRVIAPLVILLVLVAAFLLPKYLDEGAYLVPTLASLGRDPVCPYLEHEQDMVVCRRLLCRHVQSRIQDYLATVNIISHAI